MTRAKTIAFFAILGPAVGAAPFLVIIPILAVLDGNTPEIGFVLPALLMGYLYGLIPAAVSGWLFSGLVGRRPHAVHRAASLAMVGALAGFLATLPLALVVWLTAEGISGFEYGMAAATFISPGIFSGAICAVIWLRLSSAPRPTAETGGDDTRAA